MKKITSIFILLCGFALLAYQVALAQTSGPSIFDIEARAIYESRFDINTLLKMQNLERNSSYEQAVRRDYVDYLLKEMTDLGENGRSIVFFTAYGTPSTADLGYRERSGVLNSYKTAYGHLPLSKGNWTDLLKIANGVPPTAKSLQAEQDARKRFRDTFKREANTPNDAAAILIMAYGVRPAMANPKMERVALNTFKSIYGYLPIYSYQWDIMRAIAYGNIKP